MNLKYDKKLTSYFVVLLVLIIAIIFGKNMNVFTPEQQRLQNIAHTQQKLASGIYVVSADQQEYELRNRLEVMNGQCGRLFFELKSTPQGDESNSTPADNLTIRVSLSNSFNQNQELGSYQIKNNTITQIEKVEFCANGNYQNLLFQKDENSQNGSFEISNVVYYPLALNKNNFDSLLTPVVGDTDFNNIIYQSDVKAEDATNTYKFTRKNQKTGQIFTTDSNMLSGVDIKMEFTGSGGIGNYFLELREANNVDGEWKLSDRIAYFQFNKNSAKRDLKIGESVFHIPLAARLEKGKTYYIGINNNAVKFNILNTLKIYGGSANNNGNIITLVRGKSSEKSGSLYLKAYGADYVQVGGEKVLTEAKILDNGDGTGQYVYEQKGDFSDYLDIDQLISKDKSSIFYDNVQKGISAKDEGDNAFVYKINTVYPFTKMKIEANQPGGEFTDSLVYYSFDNINWTEIINDLDKDDSSSQADQNNFSQLLEGYGKTKTVYIKVTYDKDDAKEKATSAVPVSLFGLKNLKLTAELIINK